MRRPRLVVWLLPALAGAACAATPVRSEVVPGAPAREPGSITFRLVGSYPWPHHVPEADVVMHGRRHVFRDREVVIPNAYVGYHELSVQLRFAYPCHPGSNAVGTVRKQYAFITDSRSATIEVHLTTPAYADPERRFDMRFVEHGTVDEARLQARARLHPLLRQPPTSYDASCWRDAQGETGRALCSVTRDLNLMRQDSAGGDPLHAWCLAVAVQSLRALDAAGADGAEKDAVRDVMRTIGACAGGIDCGNPFAEVDLPVCDATEDWPLPLASGAP